MCVGWVEESQRIEVVVQGSSEEELSMQVVVFSLSCVMVHVLCVLCVLPAGL